MVQMSAQRKDYRATNQTQIYPSSQKLKALEIKDDITEPIFVKIEGLANSLYTLSVTTYHEQHPSTASIMISEDVYYEFKLNSKEFIIL